MIKMMMLMIGNSQWCRSKSIGRGALLIARGLFSCMHLYKKL